MKVVMTVDTIGGVWRYALDLIGALKPRGVDVVLATMGRALSSAQRTELERVPLVGLYSSDFRLEWMDDAWDDVDRAGDWLDDIVARERPDIVHYNHLMHADRDPGVPIVTVVHSCVLSWWRSVRGTDAPPEWREYRERVIKSLRNANVIVTASHAMRQEVERLYSPPHSVEVIPNAAVRATRGDSAKREHLVLAAGRIWDEAKNLASLDDVASSLAWPVYIAGDMTSPDNRRHEPTFARALGMLPPEELQEWMRRAAIYALPAWYEPFGLSILEAAHAGCALVLGDIPSLRENWDGAARFVCPADREQLRHELQVLIADPALRARLSLAAGSRARRFDLSATADRYHALYEQLTSNETTVVPHLPVHTREELNADETHGSISR